MRVRTEVHVRKARAHLGSWPLLHRLSQRSLTALQHRHAVRHSTSSLPSQQAAHARHLGHVCRALLHRDCHLPIQVALEFNSQSPCSSHTHMQESASADGASSRLNWPCCGISAASCAGLGIFLACLGPRERLCDRHLHVKQALLQHLGCVLPRLGNLPCMSRPKRAPL